MFGVVQDVEEWYLRLLVNVISPFGENKTASNGYDDWSGRAGKGRNYASNSTDHGNTGGTDNHESTCISATTGKLNLQGLFWVGCIIRTQIHQICDQGLELLAAQMLY